MVFRALKPYKDKGDNLFQGIAVALPCVMMVYATSSAHLMGLQQEQREKYEALKTIQTPEAKRASDVLNEEFASYEKQALAVIGLHLVLAVPFLLGGAYIIISALVIGLKDLCSARPTDEELDAAAQSAEDTLAKQKRTNAALALPTLSEAPSAVDQNDRDATAPPSSTVSSSSKADPDGAQQWFFRAAFEEPRADGRQRRRSFSQVRRPRWFFDTAFGEPPTPPSQGWFFNTPWDGTGPPPSVVGPGSEAGISPKQPKPRRGRRGTVQRPTSVTLQRAASADTAAAPSLANRSSRRTSALRRAASTQLMLPRKPQKKPSFRRVRSGVLKRTTTTNVASMMPVDLKAQEDEIYSFLDEVVPLVSAATINTGDDTV